MDGIAVKWAAGSRCLVKDLGLYHQMRGHELSNFIAEISGLQLWGFDRINNAVSAGKVYEVLPGGCWITLYDPHPDVTIYLCSRFSAFAYYCELLH